MITSTYSTEYLGKRYLPISFPQGITKFVTVMRAQLTHHNFPHSEETSIFKDFNISNISYLRWSTEGSDRSLRSTYPSGLITIVRRSCRTENFPDASVLISKLVCTPWLTTTVSRDLSKFNTMVYVISPWFWILTYEGRKLTVTWGSPGDLVFRTLVFYMRRKKDKEKEKTLGGLRDIYR